MAAQIQVQPVPSPVAEHLFATQHVSYCQRTLSQRQISPEDFPRQVDILQDPQVMLVIMVGLGSKERAVTAVQSGDTCARVIGSMLSLAGSRETWAVVAALANPAISIKAKASKAVLSVIQGLLWKPVKGVETLHQLL